MLVYVWFHEAHRNLSQNRSLYQTTQLLMKSQRLYPSTYVKFVYANPLVDLLKDDLYGGHHAQLDVVDLAQHCAHSDQHAGRCEV